jgi:hypothetical protein
MVLCTTARAIINQHITLGSATVESLHKVLVFACWLDLFNRNLQTFGEVLGLQPHSEYDVVSMQKC